MQVRVAASAGAKHKVTFVDGVPVSARIEELVVPMVDADVVAPALLLVQVRDREGRLAKHTSHWLGSGQLVRAPTSNTTIAPLLAAAPNARFTLSATLVRDGVEVARTTSAAFPMSAQQAYSRTDGGQHGLHVYEAEPMVAYLEFSEGHHPTCFVAIVDWGDGEQSAIDAAGPACGTVSPLLPPEWSKSQDAAVGPVGHRYARPGDYRVRIRGPFRDPWTYEERLLRVVGR